MVAEQSPLAPTRYTISNYCASDCPAGGVVKVTTTQAGTPSSSEIFDAWGRTLATQSDHFETGQRYQFNQYDAQGRLWRRHYPTISASPSAYYDQIRYDTFGRVTQTTLANGGIQQQMHTSDITTGSTLLHHTTTDPKGYQTHQYRNILGQLVRVINVLGGQLLYNYNAFGDLLTVTQIADGQSKTRLVNTYDTYGHKTQTTDDQIGTWTYHYNGFGQLIQQTDANNNVTTKIYDNLGRLAQQRSFDSNQCWTYSNQSPTIGKLTRVQFNNHLPANNSCQSIADHSIDYHYDSLGRPVQQTETINNVSNLIDDSYHQYQRYDHYGRQSHTQYAATGRTIEQLFNTQGYAYAQQNHRTDRTYQQITSMNAHGQILGIQYALSLIHI